MAKRITPETREKVKQTYLACGGINETSRVCGVPTTSVFRIVNAASDLPSVAKIHEERREAAAKKAWELLDKAFDAAQAGIEAFAKNPDPTKIKDAVTAYAILADKCLALSGQSGTQFKAGFQLESGGDFENKVRKLSAIFQQEVGK